MKTSKGHWGFDIRRIDKSVRPQDDFYHYANGTWMQRNKIPATESRWGSFTKLRVDVEKQLKQLLQTLSIAHDLKPGSDEQKVRDLYRSAMNVNLRNKLGVKPLEKIRTEIQSIKNRENLIALIARFHRLGIHVPWGHIVDQDSKDSSRYALHFAQSGLGMPDKEYYLKDDPEFLRVRDAYKNHVERNFKLLGYEGHEAERMVDAVLRVETRLAKVSMNKTDVRDAEKTYHKKTVAQLKRYAPDIDWDNYFSFAGIPTIPYVIVMQPRFIRETGKLLSSIPLSDWKIYLEWHLASSASSYLSSAFTRANFEYGRTITGSKKMKPEWRRALATVNGVLGEAFGKIYVSQHFGKEAKRKMDLLVSDLFKAYEKRIKTLNWMSPETKQKALLKLKLMQRKIGYPRRWKNYKRLAIRPDDYFGNILRASNFEHHRAMRKLKRPIDRHEWHMSPQTVNAYCNFNLNEIVFPAAILQPPFFDLHADDGINYGAIGAVIGHEITHGFDDQGAKFDGRGNMKNWWTKRDQANYKKRGAALVKQYDSYVVTKDIHVNGKLTLGENIADLGGLVIAFNAYQNRLTKTGRHTIAGFTPEQRFFLGAAQAECELYRDEHLKLQALNDPHSPSKFRVNGPLQNMPEFYEAFNVTKGDKLYREPSKRIAIW